MLGALVAISNIISIESAILGIRHELKGNIVEKNIELLISSYDLTKKLNQ